MRNLRTASFACMGNIKNCWRYNFSPTGIYVITKSEIDFILLTQYSIMDLPKQFQYNLINMINMDHIQTYASVLSTVELTTRLEQDREKWRAMFHTCTKLFPPTPFYECIYYISGHKWSMTHRVLKSHRNKTGRIYMQLWKQWALPVITTMAFWQLMHLGTWWTMLQPYIMYPRA